MSLLLVTIVVLARGQIALGVLVGIVLMLLGVDIAVTVEATVKLEGVKVIVTGFPGTVCAKIKPRTIPERQGDSVQM